MTANAVPNNKRVGVRWYGERGIINSVVSYILAHDEPVEKVISLLTGIEWPGDTHPDWIAHIKTAELVVEMAGGDFGDPDLLIICRTDMDSFPWCVFLEAKTDPYSWKCLSNSAGHLAHFNTSINGQLSLRYRFACALHTTNNSICTLNERDSKVVESPAMFAAYKSRGLETTTRKCPRRLSKPEALELLRQSGLLAGGSNTGICEERCYYVALTRDSPDHRWFDDKSLSPAFHPQFLDETGSTCAHIAKRCGWLGFAKLEETLSLASDLNHMRARATMMNAATPPENKYLHRMPDHNSDADNIAHILADACAGSVKTSGSAFSIKRAGLVVAKVSSHAGKFYVQVKSEAGRFPASPPFSGTIQSFRRWSYDSAVIDINLPDILRAVSSELARLWGPSSVE